VIKAVKEKNFSKTGRIIILVGVIILALFIFIYLLSIPSQKVPKAQEPFGTPEQTK